MPELQITLASGQPIDFFEHLATPLANNQLPLNPVTREYFSEEDRKEINRFCKTLKEKIAEFEAKLAVTEWPDFILDLNLDLSLGEEDQISLIEIIKRPDLQIIQEQAPQLKMLCKKAEELITVVEDSLIRLIWPRIPDPFFSKGPSTILNETIMYFPTSLSSSRYLYYLVKDSLKIMQSLGFIDLHSSNIACNKKVLSQKDLDNYLKTAKDFFKDNLQFQALDQLFKKRINSNLPSIQQLLGVFEAVRYSIASLVENEEYSISQMVAKQVYKRIDKLINQKETFKKNHKIIAYLQEIQLFALKEIGYCHLQEQELWQAVHYGKIAEDLAIQYKYSNWQYIFGTFHNSVKVLYRIEINNLEGANELLNKVVSSLKKNRMIYHLDLVAIACGKLAERYFVSGHYEKALDFYKSHLSLVSNFLPYFPSGQSDIDNINKKINFTEKRIHQNLLSRAEKIIVILNQNEYSSFIQNPRIESSAIIFDLKEPKDAKHIRRELIKKKISSTTIKAGIKLNISQEINIENLKEALKAGKEKPITHPLENQNNSCTSYSVIQKQISLPIEETPDTPPIPPIQSQSITEKKQHPPKQKRPMQKAASKTTANRYHAFCAPEKPRLPEKIEWGNIVFKRDDQNCRVYPLEKDKYIPQGHWFGYLNEEILSVSKEIINSINQTLKNGLFRNRGQGVKILDKTERGQSPYLYKIRLLGAYGDIRVYGHIKKAEIENKAYPLIIFDHIALNAHKKHELPKHPPCSYDDSEPTITNKFC